MDVVVYGGIFRSTYFHYQERDLSHYLLKHMEKIAELLEMKLEVLLDDYNRFTYREQRK